MFPPNYKMIFYKLPFSNAEKKWTDIFATCRDSISVSIHLNASNRLDGLLLDCIRLSDDLKSDQKSYLLQHQMQLGNRVTRLGDCCLLGDFQPMGRLLAIWATITY
jgi:hypothetical protein